MYWIATACTVVSKTLFSNTIQDITYGKGAYLVPLTTDINYTARAMAVITDYNITSELDPQNTLTIPIYEVLQPLTIPAYRLVEPRIAQHLGKPTRYAWPCYLQIAEDGGFLTMEFLLDTETSTFLNTNDFNVFMWPYNPDPGTILEQYKSLTNHDTCNAIRSFVRNGGGYIGSCYGALAASSGILRPFPVISLRHAYNVNLPCGPFMVGLALSDTIMTRKTSLENTLYVATIDITNTHCIRL